MVFRWIELVACGGQILSVSTECGIRQELHIASAICHLKRCDREEHTISKGQLWKRRRHGERVQMHRRYTHQVCSHEVYT